MTVPSHIYKIALFGLLLICISCRKSLYDVPLPSEITKNHRTAIGAYIHDQILADPETAFLEMTEHNEEAFYLVQQLYDQVTNEMHLDNKSPDFDRWSANRKWQVHIIIDVRHTAFVLPGGDIYLSTGLLRSLQSESELYSLMAMEAILMNEKYLLRKMISAYSTRTLVQIGEDQYITDSRVDNIDEDVPLFSYDIEIADEIKEKVTRLICASSIYDPRSILELPIRLSKSDQWMRTRPAGFSKTDLTQCGTLKTKGLYESMILAIL